MNTSKHDKAIQWLEDTFDTLQHLGVGAARKACEDILFGGASMAYTLGHITQQEKEEWKAKRRS